jgi:hypothetical protein
MTTSDFHIYYWAGIGVSAVKYGIGIHRISIGDDHGLDGEAVLEPVGNWCDLNVGLDYFKAMQVENYISTLLAGSAASFIRVQDQRCHLKRSLGDAGLEMKFLREVWHCLQREPDRAVAIICGSLGAYDDGDVEATTQRLWHRAARLLRQPTHHQQLKCLAQRLSETRQMAGEDVYRFLIDQ